MYYGIVKLSHGVATGQKVTLASEHEDNWCLALLLCIFLSDRLHRPIAEGDKSKASKQPISAPRAP